jgi:hypothetical protein
LTGAPQSFGPDALNRRRAVRVPMPPTGGPVSVVGARLVNASAYGMMIESFVAMERDAVLPLRLLVGGRKVDVHTRVAACTLVGVAPRKTFGIGLEFTRIPDEVREQIQAALAAYAAPPLSPR